METLDNDSQAALPGGLVPDRARFARYFSPGWRLDVASYISTFVPHGFSQLTGLWANRTHQWLATREHLQFGCLSPSTILQSNLVATFSSLTAWGERSFPVIKVKEEPLAWLVPERRRVGTRHASACVFYRSEASMPTGDWADIDPILVECLVIDAAACSSAMARLSPLAWEALQMGVEQLGKPYVPGLFPVNVPHEIVWNAF